LNITNTRPVLIVEDVEEIGKGMHQLLDRHGHRVLRATDAEQAMQMAEQDHPAMILTDMELPSFDLLMKLFREHERFGKMVVAIVDMNEPQVADASVKVLSDYDALDILMAAMPDQP
jgi:chemosensory pili system protein ChpA (sensor histidine kinase/response regulator)